MRIMWSLGLIKTVRNITRIWCAGVLMNTSRFVLWFLCVGHVKYYVCEYVCENVCVVARDKNLLWCVLSFVVGIIFFCSLWRRWTYKYTLNKIHLRHSTMNFGFGFWLGDFFVSCSFVRRVFVSGVFRIFFCECFCVYLLVKFIENIYCKNKITLCI